MKKLSYIIGLALLLICLISCSDDFLENNLRESYILSDTLFLNSNQTDVNVDVILPVAYDAGFSVFIQPKWLSFNSMYGELIDSHALLSFRIDTDKTAQGYQTQYGLIGLDVEGGGLYFFTVAYNNVPPESLKINGIVTDAEFNQLTGIMAITTRSPNSVVIYKPEEKKSNIILLGKTPKCISLSEDGHTAVIGFAERSVGYLQIEDLQITIDIPIDCIPWDIALGENGWLYVAPESALFDNLRSLNLSTGEMITRTNFGIVYGNTTIKKIKSKPYLFGSRMTTIPSGILIFNIKTGAANDSITYYHTHLGPFLVSEDGTRIYTQDGYVYNMPAINGMFNSEILVPTGRMQSNTPYFSTFEELKTNGSVFGVVLYNYLDENSFPIDEFSIYTLNKIRTFKASPVYLFENGKGKIYPTKPNFIFTDKEGIKLYVIKNIIPVYNKDYWTIETIQLN
ncbi:MAG: hypothetical protein WCE64_15295 [Bacteroidales bacterium]